MNNNTRFSKENFHFDGMYLVYGSGQYPKQYRFVARFKHCKRDRASFVKFLIANFTVEEYFNAMSDTTPVVILESKGWVSPTIKKMKALRDEAAANSALVPAWTDRVKAECQQYRKLLTVGEKKTLSLFGLPHTPAGVKGYHDIVRCNAS